METKEKGRPKGSYKYKINGVGVPIAEYEKYLTTLKAEERQKAILEKTRAKVLIGVKPALDNSLMYKLEDPVREKFNLALEKFNQQNGTKISQRDFLSLLVCKAITLINSEC